MASRSVTPRRCRMVAAALASLCLVFVLPAGAADFGIALSPASQSVVPGGTATFSVIISSSSGFAGTVSLSCSGVPAGFSCAFSPNPAPLGTATLTIPIPSTTPGGTFSFSVQGTSGGQTVTVGGSVDIRLFTLTAANDTATVVPGEVATYSLALGAVAGFADPVNLSCSGVPSGTMCNFSANPVTPPATVTLTLPTVEGLSSGGFIVYGMSGSLIRSVSLSLTVVTRPSIRVSLGPASQSVAAGGVATYTAQVTTNTGEAISNALISCLAVPSGLGCAVTPGTAGSATVRIITAVSTPPGIYQVQINVDVGPSSLTASAELIVTAGARPLMSASAAELAVSASVGSTPSPATLRLSQNPGSGLAFTAAVDGSTWLRVSPETGVIPADLQVTFLTSSLAAGTYRARILVTASSASNSPLIIPVEVTIGGARPVLPAAGITSAASFEEGASSGALVTLFGTNMLRGVTGTVSASGLPLPTELMGTFVMVNGVRAPLLAVSSNNGRDQINLQVPWQTSGAATLAFIVNNNGVESESVARQNRVSHPAVFTVNAAAALLHANGRPVTASDPASGNEVIMVFASGLGPVEPTPASGAAAGSSPLSRLVFSPVVTIGGVSSQVAFAGLAPGFVGLYQVNVTIPPGLAAGEADLVINVFGPSKAVKVPIR